MSEHLKTGNKGEQIAQEYLINLGYSILETNWRFQQLEVDVVAQINKIICFVEVKTRVNPMINPIKSITLKKQKNLLIAANQYVQSKDIQSEIRFDVITVSLIKNNVNINHVKDAFYPF